MRKLKFLKQKTKHTINYHKDKFSFLKVLFLFKFFFKKLAKYKLYLIFTNPLKAINGNKTSFKNVTYILNKKKQNYTITLYVNNHLITTATLGALISYYGAGKKGLKKSKKGFLLYLTTFKKLYLKVKEDGKSNISSVVKFFDNNLLVFFNKLSFIHTDNAKIFFNFNLNTSFKSFKKNKCIKRRVLKRKLLLAGRDWSALKSASR